MFDTMSNGMFLDAEFGMGVWTRHVTEDGRVFYYNMKRNVSKWEYEFTDSTNTTNMNDFSVKKQVKLSVEQIICRSNNPLIHKL